MSKSRSLKFRTLQLLEACETPDRELAKAVGASAPWLRLFRQGDIESPNVDLIQRLYEHLSGAPLFNDCEE